MRDSADICDQWQDAYAAMDEPAMAYQIGQRVYTPFTDRGGTPVVAEIVKIFPRSCAPYQVRFESGFEYRFDEKELCNPRPCLDPPRARAGKSN